MCPSFHNTKLASKLKSYFLRSKVDEIWHEDRCSGKVDVDFLKNFAKDNFNIDN